MPMQTEIYIWFIPEMRISLINDKFAAGLFRIYRHIYHILWEGRRVLAALTSSTILIIGRFYKPDFVQMSAAQSQANKRPRYLHLAKTDFTEAIVSVAHRLSILFMPQ